MPQSSAASAWTLDEEGRTLSVMCGRVVSNAEEALKAEEEGVELVMVALPDDSELDER